MLPVPPDAYWIGSDHPFDLHEAYFNFRKDIDLHDAPRAALLHITADSRYRLWINGVYVGRGPARCWPQAQQLDLIDVQGLLKPGRNLVEAQVYSPGYSHFAYVHRGACGLLAWLVADGHTVMATGQDWQVARDLSWRDDVPRISIYGSGVERRDLRHEAPIDLVSAIWKTPRIVARANGPIWGGLRLRDVPLLADEKIELVEPRWSAIATGPGLVQPPHEALREAWQRAEPVPTQPLELAPDRWNFRIFDLGHSRVCSGGVEIDGALGGERVFISYAEKLRDGKLLISDPQTYCRMRPTDEFILRAGKQTVEPFSQRGGRYLIFAFNAPRPVTLRAAYFANVTSYPGIDINSAQGFGKLQKIATMCARTTLACLQDGFVDSVWRESSQWLGDCVAQGFALAALSDDYRPLRRAITMAAQGAYADGILPSVLPGEVHAYTVLDYNFAWIELVHLYCRALKAHDRAGVLKSALPVMKKMLGRFKRDEDRSGLLHAERGRRLFLDWSSMDRSEPNLTYNLRYLFALQLAAKLAPPGRDRFAYANRAKRLHKAIASAFERHGEWQESPGGKPASQLALGFLILCGLLRGTRAEDTARRMTARSLDPAPQTAEGKLVLASPFMHHYVFQALQKLGHNTAILDIIAFRWGAWAEAGEPTCWENWSIDFPDGSACHGFSAHPLGWIKKLVRQE